MHFTRSSARKPARLLQAMALTGLAGAWLVPSAALANPADLFGLGAREASMGNAFTAIADDPYAAYYNMGGLAQLKRTSLSVGLQLGKYSFGDPGNCKTQDGVGCSEDFYYNQAGIETIQQRRYNYDPPHGLALGLAVPLHRKVNFGMAMYMPLSVTYDGDKLAKVGIRLARFQTIDPYLPDYVLYQNRAQRFAAYSGLSFEIVPGLGVGIGASVLAGATMKMDIKGAVTVSEGTDANGDPTTVTTTQVLPLVTMDLTPATTPVAGILWDLGSVAKPLKDWRLGVTYRGKSGLDTKALVSADIAAAANLGEDQAPISYGLSMSGIEMSLVDFYTPQQVAGGFSGVLGRVRVAADVTWTNWKAFQPSVGSIPGSVPVGLGIEVTVAEARTLETENFKNTITPRVGIEARLGPFMSASKLKGVDLYLRAGGSFEPNPFGLQNYYNNLLNSDRFTGAGGLGITTHNPLAKSGDLPISADFSLQYQRLMPTAHEKEIDPGTTPPDGYPVDGVYVSQGSALAGSFTLQFGF